MRRMLCILAVATILLVGIVPAAQPVLPESFYGSVFLNGNPAPAGTVILAKINGETQGNITTTLLGLYGGTGMDDPKLSIQLTEEQINSGNATITFFVDGVQAFQTVPFKSGGSERLDLFANSNAFATGTTTLPAYSSSGSSSGGTSGGSVASGSGTGAIPTTATVLSGSSVITPAPAESRSSIYYSVDTPLTTAVPTVVQTTVVTQPAVTTVPTTKQAGAGPLSAVFFIGTILAILVVIGRDGNKRR